MTPPLEPLHTAADVAQALGQTERYVKDRCRRREWPHRRLARGEVGFTAEDYAKILELTAIPAEQEPNPRIAFAPRSRRGAA
jgi:prophage antirepressor-like protein